jgi:hypothetical protein
LKRNKTWPCLELTQIASLNPTWFVRLFGSWSYDRLRPAFKKTHLNQLDQSVRLNKFSLIRLDPDPSVIHYWPSGTEENIFDAMGGKREGLAWWVVTNNIFIYYIYQSVSKLEPFHHPAQNQDAQTMENIEAQNISL